MPIPTKQTVFNNRRIPIAVRYQMFVADDFFGNVNFKPEIKHISNVDIILDCTCLSITNQTTSILDSSKRTACRPAT